MAKFFTRKKDGESQVIPIDDRKPKQTIAAADSHGIFDIPEDAPPAFQNLAATIGQMYNDMDPLIDNETDVRTMLMEAQSTFAGHYEAYEELLDQVEHEISKANQISNHLKNLNKLSSSRGVNLKFLEGQLEPAVRQNNEIYETMQKLPQVIAGIDPIWNEILSRQKRTVDTLVDMFTAVSSMRELQYDFKPTRVRTDWRKLKRGALNKYIRTAQPLGSANPIPASSPQNAVPSIGQTPSNELGNEAQN